MNFTQVTTYLESSRLLIYSFLANLDTGFIITAVISFCITVIAFFVACSQTIFSGVGVPILENYGLLDWRKNDKNIESHFKVSPPKSNILTLALPGDCNDNLSNCRIPYCQRDSNINISLFLEEKLEKHRWLFLTGESGVGKTREATELAQRLNNEGWTIVWINDCIKLDSSILHNELTKKNIRKKILFFYDNYADSLVNVYSYKQIRKVEKRFAKVIHEFEKRYGEKEIRVIATSGESVKHKINNNAFYFDTIRNFDSNAIASFLKEVVKKNRIEAKAGDYYCYASFATASQINISQIISTLIIARERKLPLNKCYENIWLVKYNKAVAQHPECRYIYDAIELLLYFHLPLDFYLIAQTAILVSDIKFYDFRSRYKIINAINFLIENEDIKNISFEQIYLRGKSVTVDKYINGIYKLILKRTKKDKSLKAEYLFHFVQTLQGLNVFQVVVDCVNILLSLEDVDYIETHKWLLLAHQGSAYSSQDKYEKAVNSYDEAIKLNNSDSKLWFNRGNALIELNKHQEAVLSFDEALKLKPEDEQAWYNRGNVLKDIGKDEDAIKSFRRAVEIKPDKAEAWFNCGTILIKIERFKEAIDCLNEAVKIEPEKIEAWGNLGVAYFSDINFENAVRCFDRVLSFNPNEPMAWQNYSEALFEIANYDSATEAYMKVLELNRDVDAIYIWFQLARCNSLIDEIDSAIEYLDRAISFGAYADKDLKSDFAFANLLTDRRFLELAEIAKSNKPDSI